MQALPEARERNRELEKKCEKDRKRARALKNENYMNSKRGSKDMKENEKR